MHSYTVYCKPGYICAVCELFIVLLHAATTLVNYLFHISLAFSQKTKFPINIGEFKKSPTDLDHRFNLFKSTHGGKIRTLTL